MIVIQSKLIQAIKTQRYLIPTLLLLLTGPLGLLAQDTEGVGINPTGAPPDSSAMLDISSPDKGVLIPRHTETERSKIKDPAKGLLIYNTTDSIFEYYNGKCWLHIQQAKCNPKDPDKCEFELSLGQSADTIDKVQTRSVTVPITIDQKSKTAKRISLSLLGSLPEGADYEFSKHHVSSKTTTVNLKFSAHVLTQPGTYQLVVSAVCNDAIRNKSFELTISECYKVTVTLDQEKFDLAKKFYNTHSVSSSQPVCIRSIIERDVELTSDTVSEPSYTTGKLASGSRVGLVNKGNIIAKGGDGGIGYYPPKGMDGSGEDGGDAVKLTTDGRVKNEGYIFAGGGGGNAMAASASYSLPDPADDITLAIFIGAGGGGGAGNGEGGSKPSLSIGIIAYDNGKDGGTGVFGKGGKGGRLTKDLKYTMGPVTIIITPDAKGGNGGDYGAPGKEGHLKATITAFLTATFPIVGEITFPIINNEPLPLPSPSPSPGEGGYAIDHNGNEVNIPDNTYNDDDLKGKVGY